MFRFLCRFFRLFKQFGNWRNGRIIEVYQHTKQQIGDRIQFPISGDTEPTIDIFRSVAGTIRKFFLG